MSANPEQTRAESAIQLRLWPAIVLALVHITALAYALLLGHTLIQFMVAGILIPLLVLIGMIIWWMLCRKIPFRQRFAGLALVILALAWIIITHPLITGGFSFLIVVLPIVTIGTTAVLTATASQPWPRRRAALAILMIGAAIALTAVRVDGTRGNEMPAMTWRWTPTPEERTEASLKSEAPANRTAAVSTQAGPDDWPSFRGRQRDGRASGITFATNWDDEAPTELWRRPIGIGWSSFTVVGDYFFTQEQRGENELVVCYEVGTGDQVWTNSLLVRFDETHGGGPRATPTFHEGRLYVQGAMGTLQCLEAATGEAMWKRELTEDASVDVPMWGFSSSPLIVEDLVIVFAGGANSKSVLAYNIDTGEPVWQAGDGTHSYSSVHLTSCDDVQQLLVPSNFGIQAFAPDTGEVLWQFTKTTSIDDPSCIQPLFPTPNTVLMSSELQGTRRIELSQTESGWNTEEKWHARKFRPAFNDMVYHEGFIYGFDGRLVVCIDIVTGERRWKSKRYGGQVLLLPDMNTLLLLTDKGEVILIEAAPESYNEIARFKALNGKTWNHPVIANGKLFVRNSQEAACYKLPGWVASKTDRS